MNNINTYDVVVHIGIHKTGSSALQYFLLQNRDVLEKYGYFYPSHYVNQNKISGGHSELGVLLQQQDVDSAVMLLTQYLEQARSKGAVLLISSEMIFPCFAVFKEISEILDLNVRVLAFYRDPLERISSIHGQVVKQDYQTLTLNDYCKSLIGRNDLQYFSGEMILEWTHKFGQEHVDILPYDPEVLENSKIEYMFLQAIGVNESEWGRFSYSDKLINKSYTPTAKEFKRLLNFVLKKIDVDLQKNVAIDILLQRFSDEHIEPVVALESLLQKETYDKLLDLFSESGRQVRSYIRVPLRDKWLSYNAESVTDEAQKMVACHRYSLAFIVESVFNNRPDLLSYIKNCTHEYIQQAGYTPDMIRLADAVRIEVPKSL